ncbi:MAG: hypothetical protein HY532_05145 [Chloroflexi bacterium]|nr:hypothetical protein [Chloroflexota bacterium]
MTFPLQLAGWLLFLAGCVLFTISSLRSGDLWGAAGGVLFTLGVVVFLVSLWPGRGR